MEIKQDEKNQMSRPNIDRSKIKSIAKRRASPGYARDRGFGSSGKFWEICFV